MAIAYRSGARAAKISIVAGLLLLTLGKPSLAFGQGTGISASFGYEHVSVDETHSGGVFADVAVPVAGPLSLIGAADWTRQRSQVFGFDQSLTRLAAGGGVRVGMGARRVVPFGQVLFGVERDSHDIEHFGAETSSHTLIQPGVGIAVLVAGRLGVVGAIDWRHVERGDNANGIRLALGATLRLR